MFKNVLMYRIVSPLSVTPAQLESVLQEARFQACAASQEQSQGWVEPRGVEHGALLELVGGQWILKWQVESKVLPTAVVKRRAQEQIRHVEASTGRKPGRKEVRDIHEDARLALLPLAFSKQSALWVWLDVAERLLVLDTGSQSRADAVLTALVKAIDGLAVQLIQTQVSPAVAMAQWLSNREGPTGFTVDRECELKAPDESKALVRYARHALDTEEVVQHIATGKMPTRLALTWNDHVSLVLTEALQLKKVALLEVVLETASTMASDRTEDHFDADVALITGELGQLIPALLEALGGEMPVA